MRQIQPGDEAGRLQEIEEIVEAIDPPIVEAAIPVAALAMGYVEHAVLGGRQALPSVTFVKNGKMGVMATEFNDEHGDADKDALADMMRNLRRDCEVVVFASEAWVSQLSQREYESGNWQRPKDNPQRKEVGMVQVYVKDRVVAFSSYISRNPTTMEPWRVMSDSVRGGKLGGRFS